jgi:hypothetical protein
MVLTNNILHKSYIFYSLISFEMRGRHIKGMKKKEKGEKNGTA